ncbi:hypothetical protein A1O7_03969 [Cladophialophora yegresii CBS 114405]|uniref:Uncharacterized protein n=1 Tax=Cladophialophora yegresii CBS 114405 TaxID=1182544 RepID=W9VVK7_9EURO|nr:uncharacterized protein A1O7_03969 [Cladophialophora yegresii CBS 114405]EXJ59822.1 hypothetical protein A1O7_03969 [Cladophialophora yegresii CBS 114405]
MASSSGPNQAAYLSWVDSLKDAYPALGQLFNKLAEFKDQGRQILESTFNSDYGISPGRCAVLESADGGRQS